MGFENRLLALALIAIIVLTAVAVDLLNDDQETTIEYIYIEKVVDERTEPVQDNETEPLTRSEVARVATFNIKVFGKTKMSKPEVVAELVTIFERYDLVAVQEIKDIDEQVPYQFLDALNNNSSIDWKMVLSLRTGLQEDDQNSQEQYAYYYRSDVFISLDNGSLYNDSEKDSFQREPLVSQFELLDLAGNSTGLDFTLINIHTKPTAAVSEMEGLQDVLNWSAEIFDEDDQIILGDFNGDCTYASYQELISLSISTANHTWIIPDDADTTVGDSRCAYDRVVATSNLDERLTGYWGVDMDISSGNVSDHRPVWFDISRV
ncbi:MAG: endonuclease/exonuclease/phosphatase family protein [Candidatus Poseidoniales archaeon]|jgi:endonuclease/exonuclease/phosphatase family metal-dependent hydrolase